MCHDPSVTAADSDRDCDGQWPGPGAALARPGPASGAAQRTGIRTSDPRAAAPGIRTSDPAAPPPAAGTVPGPP